MSKELSLLKVTELKVLLKEKGLKVSGLKAELIQRLKDYEKSKTKPTNKKRQISDEPDEIIIETFPKLHKAAPETHNLVPGFRRQITKTETPVFYDSQSKPSVCGSKKSSQTSVPKFNAFDDELMDFFGDTETYTAIKNRIVEESDQIIKECPHEVCFEADGINICKSCGCEVEKLDFQPEWRYYGSSDTRSSKDPSRCHRSKESTRGGIDKVFQDASLMFLPQAIRKKAEEKYKKIVGKETVRGRKRKSIVAACLLYTFRDEGDVRTSDEIRKMFAGTTGQRDILSKQEMSDGLRRYHSVFKEDRTQCVKPLHLIKRTMHLTKINFQHYKYILRIAKCLDGVDAILNRSSPQSVASAIVYLYLLMNPDVKASLNLTKTRFAKEVKLSDITITKLVKRSADILGLQIEI